MDISKQYEERLRGADVLLRMRVGQAQYDCTPKDVSRKGICLRVSNVIHRSIRRNTSVSIITDDNCIVGNGRLLRPGPRDSRQYAAIQFDNPLDDAMLGRLTNAQPPVPPIQLVRNDYEEVSREIRDIQSCRSNIFIGILAALATAGIVVWRYYASSEYDWSGLTLALLCIMTFFVTGILATIEKVRAINYRKGFLAVLSLYLNGTLPVRRYKGWGILKACRDECTARCDANQCQRKIQERGPGTCRDPGNAQSAGLTEQKRLVPRMLESFTCLSSYLYGILYALLGTLFVVSLAYYLREFKFSKQIQAFMADSSQQLWYVRLSVVITIVLFLIGVILSIIFINRNKCVSAVLVFTSLTPLLLHKVDGLDWSPFPTAALIYTTPLICGLCLGSIGFFLFRQLYFVRSGKYSSETCFYTWITMLPTCDPLPLSPPPPTGTHRNGLRYFGSWLLHWIFRVDAPSERYQRYQKDEHAWKAEQFYKKHGQP